MTHIFFRGLVGICYDCEKVHINFLNAIMVIVYYQFKRIVTKKGLLNVAVISDIYKKSSKRHVKRMVPSSVW
jgi:hypothetical protein